MIGVDRGAGYHILPPYAVENMMQVTVRNPLWAVRERYFCYIPETETYTGERIATPPWVEYPALCITAPIPGGFRIIDLERVISIDDQGFTAPAKNEKPGADRVVRVTGDREIGRAHV